MHMCNVFKKTLLAHVYYFVVLIPFLASLVRLIDNCLSKACKRFLFYQIAICIARLPRYLSDFVECGLKCKLSSL